MPLISTPKNELPYKLTCDLEVLQLLIVYYFEKQFPSEECGFISIRETFSCMKCLSDCVFPKLQFILLARTVFLQGQSSNEQKNNQATSHQACGKVF